MYFCTKEQRKWCHIQAVKEICHLPCHRLEHTAVRAGAALLVWASPNSPLQLLQDTRTRGRATLGSLVPLGHSASLGVAIWFVFRPNFLMEPRQSADKMQIIREEYPDHICSRHVITAGIGWDTAGVWLRWLRNTEANLYSLVTLNCLILEGESIKK